MKNTKLLYKTLFKKVFGSAKQQLYTTLFSIFSEVASQKDYLENLTTHADAIHWHLNRVCIDDFELILSNYFSSFIKQLRKDTNWHKISVAFDETYIPFYGKPTNNWIAQYNNNIKGATGSYKFMVCSIIANKKRYILQILPMYNGQNTTHVVSRMLDEIKQKFRIDTLICDRGFCKKKLCRELEQKNLKYIILAPKWKNIKKYLEQDIDHITEKTLINEKKSNYIFDWRFVFCRNEQGYDWAFATNLQENPQNIVKLYKCRWGIETNFRIMDFADIKSKSKNIVTRCFFFFLSAFLFNSWLELAQDMTFESYLDSIALAQSQLEVIIQKWKEARKLFGISIRKSEHIILSSFTNFYEYFDIF